MLKEWVQKRAAEFGTRSLQWGKGYGLKPEGKPQFENLIHSILEARPTALSEYIHILDGFLLTDPKGTDKLRGLNGKNFLLFANHPKEGPLKGYGQTIFTSTSVKDATGEELRPVRGHGKALEDFARKPAEIPLNAIDVGDGTGVAGVRKLLRAINNNESVLLYPEGKKGKKLQHGDYRAGKIMLLFAEKNVPIMCAATWFENNTFFITFEGPLDNEKIVELGQALRNKTRKEAQEIGKNIIDYAMSTIAQNLPENRR